MSIQNQENQLIFVYCFLKKISFPQICLFCNHNSFLLSIHAYYNINDSYYIKHILLESSNNNIHKLWLSIMINKSNLLILVLFTFKYSPIIVLHFEVIVIFPVLFPFLSLSLTHRKYSHSLDCTLQYLIIVPIMFFYQG